MSERNGNGRLRPVYDNRISLGNIVSLAAMLVAGIWAISEVKSELKSDIRVLFAELGSQDERLVKVENRTGLGTRAPMERDLK